MTKEQFVRAVKISTMDTAVQDLVSGLERPAGRKPSSELVALSNWYLSLSVEGRDMLRVALKEISEATAFGFFCILDGVRAIEGIGEKGTLKLVYSKGEESSLLNDPNDELLHDIYQSFRSL